LTAQPNPATLDFMKMVLRILSFIIFLAATLYVKTALAETAQDPNDAIEQNTQALDEEWARCALKYGDLNKRYLKAATSINESLKSNSVKVDSETCFLVLQAEMVILYVGETCLDLGRKIQKTDSPNKAFVTKIDRNIRESVKSFREVIDKRAPLCEALKRHENKKKPKVQGIY
jgi:hypothetical protein